MVLDFSKGRTPHLCHVIACILWIISEVWHVSLIWQSDPLCSLPGSLASPVSFPLVWTGWNPLETVRPGLDSHLCPLLAVSLQSGYTSVLRLSFLIYKMGLLKVRSEVVMGLNSGEVYWIFYPSLHWGRHSFPSWNQPGRQERHCMLCLPSHVLQELWQGAHRWLSSSV